MILSSSNIDFPANIQDPAGLHLNDSGDSLCGSPQQPGSHSFHLFGNIQHLLDGLAHELDSGHQMFVFFPLSLEYLENS